MVRGGLGIRFLRGAGRSLGGSSVGRGRGRGIFRASVGRLRVGLELELGSKARSNRDQLSSPAPHQQEPPPPFLARGNSWKLGPLTTSDQDHINLPPRQGTLQTVNPLRRSTDRRPGMEGR